MIESSQPGESCGTGRESSAEGADGGDNPQPCSPAFIVISSYDYETDDDYDDAVGVLPGSIFHTADKAGHGRDPIVAKKPFAKTWDNLDALYAAGEDHQNGDDDISKHQKVNWKPEI